MWIRIRMDPNLFYLLENFSNKNRKNTRKLVIIASLFNLLSKFAQTSLFLTLEPSFMCFFQLKTLLIRLFFLQICLTWSGSARRKTAGSVSAKNECGSTAPNLPSLTLFLTPPLLMGIYLGCLRSPGVAACPGPDDSRRGCCCWSPPPGPARSCWWRSALGRHPGPDRCCCCCSHHRHHRSAAYKS